MIFNLKLLITIIAFRDRECCLTYDLKPSQVIVRFRMGSCGSQPEVIDATPEQKRENKKIDDGIAKEREEMRKTIKLLLLG